MLFYHTELACSGGFIGVDVFFVISGYLITCVLLREAKDSGSFSLAKFWARRIRRLLPALVVMMSVTGLAGWCLLLPEDLAELGQSFMAQSCLMSNVFFWKSIGYFKGEADIKPLLHAWSLAVEEQFYLVYPTFLLLGLRRRRLAEFTLSALVVSLALSAYGGAKFPSATFYLLPTRAWELLVGALAACWVPTHRASTPLKELMSWSGVALILYPAFYYSSQTLFHGIYPILPCVGTLLIIISNTGALTTVGRLLAQRVFVGVGLISYSLYLWHWPLMAFARYTTLGELSTETRLMVFLASLATGYGSYVFVERPFRKALLPTQLKAYVFAGATGLGLFAVGWQFSASGGFPSRLPVRVVAFSRARAVGNLKQTSLKDAIAGRFFGIGSSQPAKGERFLLWGDSFALAALPAFESLADQHDTEGFLASCGGTPPLLDYTETGEAGLHQQAPIYNQAVLEFVRRQRLHRVILVSRWSVYSQTRIPECLEKTARALKECGASVWVIKEVPQQPFDVPRALALTALRKQPCDGVSLEKHRAYTAVFSATAKKLEEMGIIRILDPADLMVSKSGECLMQKDGVSWYRDAYHLSPEGALLLAPLFEKIFQPEP